MLGSGYAERPALSNSEDSVNLALGLCRPPNASQAPSPADNPVIGDPNAPVQNALFQLNLCSKNADQGKHQCVQPRAREAGCTHSALCMCAQFQAADRLAMQ